MALVTEQGYKIAEAAHSQDINANMLGRWKQGFEARATGKVLNSDEKEELHQLLRENRELLYIDTIYFPCCINAH